MNETIKNVPTHKLLMKFDGKDEETKYSARFTELINMVINKFEDIGSDGLPTVTEFNQRGQLIRCSLHIDGMFPKEVFPLLPSDHPLTSAEITLLKNERVLEGYEIAEGVQAKHRSVAWACIKESMVIELIHIPFLEDYETSKHRQNDALRILSAKGDRVVYGEVRGRRLVVTKPWRPKE